MEMGLTLGEAQAIAKDKTQWRRDIIRPYAPLGPQGLMKMTHLVSYNVPKEYGWSKSHSSPALFTTDLAGFQFSFLSFFC